MTIEEGDIKELLDIELDGKYAYSEGKTVADCPWPETSLQWYFWAGGWTMGMTLSAMQDMAGQVMLAVAGIKDVQDILQNTPREQLEVGEIHERLEAIKGHLNG